MSVVLAPVPFFQAFTTSGAPLVGGKLFTFAAGTSTPQASYIDSTQTTQNTNPVILNSLGQCSLWLVQNQVYKLVLQDANGNPQWSQDNVPGGVPVPLNIGPPAFGPALIVNGGPSSNAITVNNPSTQPAISILNGSGGGQGVSVNSAANTTCTALQFNQNGQTIWQIIQPASTSNFAITNGITNPITIGATGNITLALPSVGGPTLTLSASIGSQAITINNPSPGQAGIIVSTTAGGVGFQVSATAGQNAVGLQFNQSGQSIWQILEPAGTSNFVVSNGVTNVLTASTAGNVSINGASPPPAPITGWGTPTGGVTVNNYSGAAATLVQTSNAVAQIITQLKAFGLFGA